MPFVSAVVIRKTNFSAEKRRGELHSLLWNIHLKELKTWEVFLKKKKRGGEEGEEVRPPAVAAVLWSGRVRGVTSVR